MIGRLILLRLRGLSMQARLALAGLFLIALVALFPLRLALAIVPGVAARDVQGPAWWGEVHDARLGPVALPFAHAGLLPWGGIWIQGSGITAHIAGSGANLNVSGVTGTVPLPDGVDGVPVESASFEGFGFALEQGRCRSAQGSLRVILTTPQGSLPLTGSARCNGGELAVPLQGPGGLERVVLRLSPAGRISIAPLRL